MKPPGDPCPCGSSRPYAACCGLCHAGAPAATADALLLYDRADGKRLPGLTRRRKAERALFLKP